MSLEDVMNDPAHKEAINEMVTLAMLIDNMEDDRCRFHHVAWWDRSRQVQQDDNLRIFQFLNK